MVLAVALAFGSLLASAFGAPSPPTDLQACQGIAAAISSASGVFYSGELPGDIIPGLCEHPASRELTGS